MSKKIACLPLLFFVSIVFSQDVIRFEIPADFVSDAEVKPQRPDTVQKLGPMSNQPLNLVLLAAKDTASFETYSRRLALVRDSISVAHRAIDAVKKNSVSFMPVLGPRGEFEKQSEYDIRKHNWDKELFERTERDTKSLTVRLEELERAKKKIEEHRALMYGSISIKSNPEAASIYIGKDEIGATPADYNLLIPGTVKISVRKEGYNPWDTTFQVAPRAKFMFNISLEEKSIFSEANEIDFVAFLKRDAAVEGYKSRINVIEARKVQIDEEIKQIMENFARNYPPLEPQRVDETPDAFKKRHEAWTREGMRSVADFQRKHANYKQKLARCIAVLKDYIIATQSNIVNAAVFAAKIELGTYDPDSEQFELVAQDTASEKSPFYFRGRVGIPRDTARIIDRAAPSIVTNLQFINYPFGEVNLAMSKLLLSRNGLNFKVDGSFSEIERYKSEEGYAEWKLRADSLLSGNLKAQGLDYAYAMGRAAAQEATVAVAKEKESGGGGLGWRGWTRIIAFTAAFACGGAAVYKHLEAQKEVDKLNDLINNPVDSSGWIDTYNETANLIKDVESHRKIFSIAAGVFAFGGVVTFFF
ncbi:MAG: PEGA domain-containing protein [Fibromonadales bacterium]|nr:PEGA domain-containing protein [Fibromonadales bacterium]